MRGVIAALAAVAGCGVPTRGNEPLAAPTCGDGIVQPSYPISQTQDAYETCDDGMRNGTSDSLCTKQCQTPDSPYGVAHAFPLGHVANRAVSFHWGDDFGEGDALAFTAYDDTGIHVTWTYLGAFATLKVAANPVALSLAFPDGLFISGAPLWIEGPSATDPAFHMYYADLAADRETPQTHEIQYPFADGTRPYLVAPSLFQNSAMVIDQSNVAPFDLLVAAMYIHAPDDVQTLTLRVPAAGQMRGVAIPSLNWDDVADPTEHHIYWRVVQFFDDTLGYVAVELRSSYPLQGIDPDALYESARGTFPYRVTGGSELAKGGAGLDNLLPPPEVTHPSPLVVLTDIGTMFEWQFDGRDTNGDEGLPSPWATTSPGSLVSWMWGDGDIAALGVFAPDGSWEHLFDGDSQDVDSTALEPQRWFQSPRWTTAAEIWPGHADGYFGVILDGTRWR